jgi:DUF971 family protein
MSPAEIKIESQTRMIIKWNDSTVATIPLVKLRKYCPCAVCSTERESQSKSYIPLFDSNQIKISKISSIGKYAIGIVWSDGHNTGIYEFPFLKSLSEN